MPFVLAALWRLRNRRKRQEQRARAKRGALLLVGTSVAGWLLAMLEKRRRRNGSITAAMHHGAREAARAVAPERTYDDKTLEAKVQTELFRPKNAPKNKVNVQVVDGVVELRGKLDAAKAAKLASQAQSIEGVSGVRNLINTAA